MYQAGIVVADILGREHTPAEYHAVPQVTFTDPEIGSVGVTEAEARDRGHRRPGGPDADTHLRPGLDPQGRQRRLHQAGRGRRRGVLVGATSAGPWGGEVLSMLVLAVHAAVPVQRLREMIYAYPTFHRAVSDALSELPDDRPAAPPPGSARTLGVPRR